MPDPASNPRICFIVNPAAGHGRAKSNWERVKPLADSLGEYTLRFTEAPGHGVDLARQAAEEGFDRVGAFGGDGTLNEVGNGLLEAAQAAVAGSGEGGGAAPGKPEPGSPRLTPSSSRTALALIPTGSANDWVRQFPIPTDIGEALKLAFAGHRATVDAGLVTKEAAEAPEPGASGAGADATPVIRRYFFNLIGTGFDAEAAERVNRFGPVLKVFPGTFPTVVCVLITLAVFRYPTLTLRIEGPAADGADTAPCLRELTIPRAILSSFGVCGYVGGGMWLFPRADPTDGLLDVFWAHRLSRLGILNLLTKIYKGKHVDHPLVELTRAKRVEVSASRPMIWHIDGEILGRLPITVESVPKALDIIVP